MKITKVEPITLSIPFEAGGAGEGIMPTTWNTLDFCIVRIEADNGLIGWGEGFGYFCHKSVAEMVKRSLAPLLVGEKLPDPRAFNQEAQRKMVLQGRGGVSFYALSGVDIALWDLTAREAGVPLHELLGQRCRDSIPAYASLVRYGDSDLVASKSIEACEKGYPEIRLHEITMPEIRKCREVIGPDIEMIVDVNCNWSAEFTRGVIPELKDLNTRWLEEPTFPPEDYHLLADIRKEGLAVATGENACGLHPFSEMARLQATDFLQPSITKVGGISVFLDILEYNRSSWKLPLMPHSPYFGPGYLATLQMAALEPDFDLFEYLYIEPERWLFQDMPLPENGHIAIPEGVGLGYDPQL